jgi:hypothetical protein
MKKIFLFLILPLIILTACDDDDLNVDELLSYPPTIMSVTPKTSVKIGDFKIKIILADGPQSPLSNISLTLKNAAGTQLYTVSETLQGTIDSLVVPGSAFNAASLPLGDYSMTLNATDSKGNIVETISNFKIATQLYPANNDAMFIAGVFNGWGASEMELVADNTWEIKNVDLQGSPWKFKNTADWSDEDWGDSNCDKIVEISTNGGPNTECDYSGAVNIRFNDETLKYSVLPNITFKTALSGLYLLGNVNNYEGTDYKFQLVADNTWELSEVRLKPGSKFKFSESPYFSGLILGDPEFDGKAAEDTPYTVVPNTYADAFYKIVFNESNRKYQFTFVRYPYPPHLYLVGNATPADWNNGSMVAMFRDVANGFKFTYTGKLNSGELKIIGERGQWQPQYGKGANEGELAVNDGTGSDPGTIAIGSAGYYTITVDVNAKTYSVAPYNATGAPVYATIGVIGSATPGGWDNDTDMTQEVSDPHQWYIDGQALTVAPDADKIKFRADNAWTTNWGSNSFPFGKGTPGGADIPVSEAGNYLIRFCDLTGEYAIIKK